MRSSSPEKSAKLSTASRRPTAVNTHVRAFAAISIIAALLSSVAHAEPSITELAKSEQLGIKVALVLPPEGIATPGDPDGDGVSALVKLQDDRVHGIIVRVTNLSGTQLWQRDFGYNWSAARGGTVTVELSEQHNAIIVHYSGYKWDHAHELLFVSCGSTSSKKAALLQYTPEAIQAAILPMLKGRSEFTGNDYLISPARFSEAGVLFGCTPLARSDAPHPFDQQAARFLIDTRIDANGALHPLAVLEGE